MRKAVVIAAAVMLAAAFSDTSVQARRVPSGSFIRHPVSSVDELADQIVRDPVVRNRFARHFGVRSEKLDEYIRDNVMITSVTANTPKRVYFVTTSGRVVVRRSVLKRGDSIFALKDTGEPLFVQACGNPVVQKLPPTVKVETKTLPSVQVLRPNEMPLPPPTAALPPIAVVLPVEQMAPIPPLVPAAAPPLAAAPVEPASRNRFPWFIPPLVAAVGDGGGKGQPPPPVIPEPGGAAAVFATVLIPAVGYGVNRFRTTRRSARE